MLYHPASSLLVTTSIPSLLKPNLLIKAWSSSSLKILGFGFPNCFLGVTVPTSTKPNPSLNIELKTSALLSNPAARPIGFFILLLKKDISNTSSFSTLKVFLELYSVLKI